MIVLPAIAAVCLLLNRLPAMLLALLQGPFTLKALLEAADVPPPYILVGHGRGGQLALQVRGTD
jgi:hypothetical protein